MRKGGMRDKNSLEKGIEKVWKSGKGVYLCSR
jgi:hypothetical protein